MAGGKPCSSFALNRPRIAGHSGPGVGGRQGTRLSCRSGGRLKSSCKIEEKLTASRPRYGRLMTLSGFRRSEEYLLEVSFQGADQESKHEADQEVGVSQYSDFKLQRCDASRLGGPA